MDRVARSFDVKDAQARLPTGTLEHAEELVFGVFEKLDGFGRMTKAIEERGAPFRATSENNRNQFRIP